MTSKAAIPVLRSGLVEVDRFAEVIKQNMDWLTGQQKNSPAVKALASTATLSEVIAEVNKIIRRIDG